MEILTKVEELHIGMGLQLAPGKSLWAWGILQSTKENDGFDLRCQALLGDIRFSVVSFLYFHNQISLLCLSYLFVFFVRLFFFFFFWIMRY